MSQSNTTGVSSVSASRRGASTTASTSPPVASSTASTSATATVARPRPAALAPSRPSPLQTQHSDWGVNPFAAGPSDDDAAAAPPSVPRARGTGPSYGRPLAPFPSLFPAPAYGDAPPVAAPGTDNTFGGYDLRLGLEHLLASPAASSLLESHPELLDDGAHEWLSPHLKRLVIKYMIKHDLGPIVPEGFGGRVGGGGVEDMELDGRFNAPGRRERLGEDSGMGVDGGAVEAGDGEVAEGGGAEEEEEPRRVWEPMEMEEPGLVEQRAREERSDRRWKYVRKVLVVLTMVSFVGLAAYVMFFSKIAF